MPPHITEYLDFVNDKTLFIFMKNGDIIIDPRMSTAIGKLYIFVYWEKYIKLGNSPSTLYNTMASIRNDADPIRFDKYGYQTNKRQMLDLESANFLGLMGEEYYSKYWYSILKITIYIFLIGLGVYFVKLNYLDNIEWNFLMSLSKLNPFS